MTAFHIDRSRITRVRSNNLSAYLTGGQLIVRRFKFTDGKPVPDPIIASDLFGADIWQLEVGYEAWGETNGKKHRETALVPYGQTPPPTPIDGIPIYQLPIYSAQWGGRADLIINDRVGSEGLADLCDQLNTFPEFHSNNPVMIPHIEITGTEEGPFGVKPIFTIAEWAERPNRWGEVKINPVPAPSAVPEGGKDSLVQRLYERNQRRDSIAD